MNYRDITIDLVMRYFPELKQRIKSAQEFWATTDLTPYDLLYSVIFLDVLEQQQYGAYAQIQKYFDFVEMLLQMSADTEVDNLIQVGFLEYFWDTPQLYSLAQQCMGKLTRKLFLKIHTYTKIPDETLEKPSN